MTPSSPKPRTLAELRASGYRSRTVKQELRENLIAAIREGRTLFPGIVGYDKTVVPQLENAILSQHDFILLGLRGQAKTRILRALPAFLDEWLPAVQGCELNDDPLAPVCRSCRARLEKQGEALEIVWLSREERYREKLATPDVTIADLIGDVDPIKAATRRLTFADEEVIHYGIIPRTNRGIFAVNELPDLQPRIQVGLLNILEEKDIQIRGFPVRIPLDLLLVFSANPEDYTNRGNIITPLRDRIASQITTHYPLSIEDGMAITRQEAWAARDAGVEVEVPQWYRELIEEIAIQARKSEYVDQSSGVSARMTIALLENVISNAERRGLRTGEKHVLPRLADLHGALSAISGKVELVFEGEQEGPVNVARHLIGRGVKGLFARRLPDAYRTKGKDPTANSVYRPVLDWFAAGKTVEVSDETPANDFYCGLAQVSGLEGLAHKHLDVSTPEELGPAMEFVLEGLHQNSALSRERVDAGQVSYRDMLKSMLSGMRTRDEDEDD
ncbi:MAG TPA: magnesium chelatase [Candidatus Eisenbacteria bacterium]|nr:magnesium chelatase [Candidatus Eisenbacteria bacterium]